MMLPTRLKRLFTFYSLLPTIFSVVVSAQQCYYPNGDVSKTDAPCSSAEGAACCPLNWQCLDNGLCYLNSEKYFGRYTCTDKSWKSSACPGFCTNNNKDSGNQAVQQCSNHGGQYCCDQNRDASNVCCNRNDDTPFFVLPRGNPTATIASLGGPAEATSNANSNNNNNDPNQQSDAANNNNNNNNNNDNNQNPATINRPTNPAPPSISLPPNPATTLRAPPPASSPIVITSSSTASNPNGQTSIILITSIIPSTPAPSPSTTGAAPTALPASSPGGNNTTSAAAIGGGIGGGVAALLALGLLAFYLRRRHQRRKASEISAATMPRPQTTDHGGGMEYMYKNQGGAKDGTPYTGSTLQGEGTSPEIDGVEVVGRKVGGIRPGEKTRVDVEGGKGLGLEREGVSELPGEDVPWSRGAPTPQPPGQLDGEGVDKWRAYQIAAGRGQP